MASLPLSGKTALITGASRGIGRAIALELASQGAKVVVNYSSDPTPATSLVQQIGPSHAHAIKADASSLPSLDHLIAETTAWSGGKIDILVPNAGVLMMRDLQSTTEEDWDRTMSVNVKGPWFLAQKALPYMSEGAQIVFLSSSLCAASTVAPGYLLYNASKGAIEQMTRVLAKDLGRRGIRVNAVAPGPTGTELFYEGKSEAVLGAIRGLNPFGRIGEPEEIAGVVGFLAGGKSGWVNGQILRVNGGMTVG
ncbi:NAD(P)-binding protein [Corynespora cassiicola Philippines]|uniref:NAD(P)-binding protein n=1 Tax=Corynespora cassiicola Philippines TaxID=1448308 RepID=A0A2T2NHV4_CORCC|nr:NAD(P)-binding protein [Corynespora cassiicola Philippines]